MLFEGNERKELEQKMKREDGCRRAVAHAQVAGSALRVGASL